MLRIIEPEVNIYPWLENTKEVYENQWVITD